MTNRVAVCSWSLRPGSPAELLSEVRACGLARVQLALDPLRTGAWSTDATWAALESAAIEVVSGMMATKGEDYSTLEAIARTGGFRPDATWPENEAAAAGNARLARRLGIPLVSFHAGFLPEQPGPERARLLERLREVCDLFAAEGVRVALETGQERAATLLAFLDELDRPEAGINFDPANMILYDMDDPVEALAALLPRVLQLHVKDAVRTRVPGTWGQEVVAGTGDVRWGELFALVRERAPDRTLVIEREAGEARVADVRAAVELIESHLPGAAVG